MAALTVDSLWTNESPSASFAAQDVEVDNFSDYSIVLVVYRHFGSANTMGHGVLPIMGVGNYLLNVVSTSNNRNGNRNLTVYESGKISFTACTYNNSTNNDYGVPLGIYGIKGD